MCRIAQQFGILTLSIGVACSAAAQPEPSVPRWQIYARCAAAYQANWQLRQAVRARDMSDMIREQSEDFKNKAMNFYQSDLNVPPTEARQHVDDYLRTSLDEFIAMERAGTLESYLDQCPAD
jgi:hypothetical protein